MGFVEIKRSLESVNDFSLLSNLVDLEINNSDLNEMAYPAYFEGNFLSRWVFFGRLARIIQHSNVDQGMQVLDFGCGLGLLLPYFHQRGCEPVGVDLFPGIAQRYMLELDLDAPVYSSLAEVKDDVLFDSIFALDVLEHVPDTGEVISELRGFLQPDGMFVISGPTENWLYQVGRKVVGFKGDYHHRNIDDIFTEVEAAGLKPIKVVHWPFPGACLFKCGYFQQV
jgi:2-polyprenyl-3-methyl-5-hydroxy-6-metoxy-1,4-benzoquinol methylase